MAIVMHDWLVMNCHLSCGDVRCPSAWFSVLWVVAGSPGKPCKVERPRVPTGQATSTGWLNWFGHVLDLKCGVCFAFYWWFETVEAVTFCHWNRCWFGPKSDRPTELNLGSTGAVGGGGQQRWSPFPHLCARNELLRCLGKKLCVTMRLLTSLNSSCWYRDIWGF